MHCIHSTERQYIFQWNIAIYLILKPLCCYYNWTATLANSSTLCKILLSKCTYCRAGNLKEIMKRYWKLVFYAFIVELKIPTYLFPGWKSFHSRLVISDTQVGMYVSKRKMYEIFSVWFSYTVKKQFICKHWLKNWLLKSPVK